ncbi:hypothetical protein Gotur_019860, partial [Gossypium turneri]
MTSSGESSSTRNATMADAELKQLSPLSIITLRNIKDRPHQKKNRKLPGGTVRYFDNNEPRYGWLLNGWLAEERRVPSGRLYRECNNGRCRTEAIVAVIDNHFAEYKRSASSKEQQ